MTNLPAFRKNNLLPNLLTILFSLTFLTVWLPLIRSLFDGTSYQWGLAYFGTTLSGAGMTWSWSFLFLQAVFFAALFIGIYRMPRRKLIFGLVILWWIHVFGNLLYEIITEGDTMFHGDTLDVHISLATIVIPLSLVALLLIILWVRRDMANSGVVIPWTKRNTVLAWMILGPLPVQGILLASGEPHDITDQIGVIIALAQCFAIPFIFRPYGQQE